MNIESSKKIFRMGRDTQPYHKQNEKTSLRGLMCYFYNYVSFLNIIICQKFYNCVGSSENLGKFYPYFLQVKLILVFKY
jgi:hypothetical protein